MLGRDHGQGSFRSPVRIIKQKVKVIECVIAEVECKTESEEVLRKTILEVLDCALGRMVNRKLVDHGNILNDGNIIMHRAASGEIHGGFNTVEKKNANDTFLCCRDIRVLIAGDLAFYALMLGMENMDGSWCVYCKMKKSDWESDYPPASEPRTIAMIKETAEGLLDGQKHKFGVKKKPPFNFVWEWKKDPSAAETWWETRAKLHWKELMK